MGGVGWGLYLLGGGWWYSFVVGGGLCRFGGVRCLFWGVRFWSCYRLSWGEGEDVRLFFEGVLGEGNV